MLEMNPEIREQWCAALRSGEYKQTTGGLRADAGSGVGYCCLGVLADLYVKATGKETCTDEGTQTQVPLWEEGTLPLDVSNWAGLDGDDNPVLQDMNGESHLASGWNDDRGADFNKIADMIDGGKS